MMRISLYSALAVLSFGLIASQQPAAASSILDLHEPRIRLRIGRVAIGLKLQLPLA